MKPIYCLYLIWILLLYSGSSFAQSKLYFTDGYHGGIYGHYPIWYTDFIVDKLEQNPFWKINLEIEPETWDTVQVRDAAGYARWEKILQDSEFQNRIEFVNPAYAQPYGYNISGESLIRQFQYGMRKINQHFPQARFSTYSSEEPCFTSCLPGILNSLGFSYAVLKNPNTCWGGYFRASGGELLRWVGPDGTSTLTSPRYSCEYLLPGSTWQTIAWNLSKEYVDTCVKSGIATPVGMCYQDAGWKNGPWLGDNSKAEQSFEYVLWRDYFKSGTNAALAPNRKFSQEDVLPGLVWGAQVLQQLSQQVRASENKLVQSEKIAALTCYLNGKAYPNHSFDNAWRTLMLSQHHDCWIVPYNGKPGYTWAHDVKRWTAYTNGVCDSIVLASVPVNSENSKELLLKVFNTTGEQRIGLASFLLPLGWETDEVTVVNVKGKPCSSQVIKDGEQKTILFLADIQAMGFSTFKIIKKKAPAEKGASAQTLADGSVRLQTDIYDLIIDPSRGGTITKLIRKSDGFNFVGSSKIFAFNGLRGNFYDEGGFHSSTDGKARLSIIEAGPLRVRVILSNNLNGQPYKQVISIEQGQQTIDCSLEIDWMGKPGIGAYNQQKDYKAEQYNKAFYNDRYKLHLTFPFAENAQIYKDAPFDVCRSELDNTFFGSWDSLKHNVILHWVDAYDSLSHKGLALFSDHTTSYLYGAGEPLGLTVQYIGKGLWGRNYTVDSLTRIHYALLPHEGLWDKAGIQRESSNWNELLIAKPVLLQEKDQKEFSLFQFDVPGMEVSTVFADGDNLLVRLYNAACTREKQQLIIYAKCSGVEMVRLNGEIEAVLPVGITKNGNAFVNLAIPRFGVQTLKLKILK